MPATHDIPDEVLDQAIDWLVKLRSGSGGPDSRLRANIDAWRVAHPRHDQVWHELNAAEGEFKRLSALPIPASQLQGALSQIQESRERRDDRRRFLRHMAFGVGVVTIGALAARYAGLADAWEGGAYATAVGGRRAVQLPDGTRLALNTDSSLRVHYDGQRRLLVLEQGEIFVETGADAGAAHRRPFWIQAGHSRFQALGTAFYVRLDAGGARLAVTQGRVAVHAGGMLKAVVRPGEMVDVDQGGLIGRSDIAGAVIDPTGWIDNALVVKQMRLQDFARELARYRRGWLQCDPAVADLLVSGVFQTDDSDLALDSLVRALPVAIERRTRFWVRIVPAGNDS